MTTTATPPRTTGIPSLPDQLARQRSSRRRVRRVVVALAVTAVVVTSVWLVYFSHVLDARTVDVTGVRELTVKQVQTAAAVPLGVPLARQDLDAIARRATALPQVSAARVTREWPHGVSLVVTERQPLLGIARSDGFLMVDKEGYGFEAKPTLPSGVITVEVDPTNRPLLVELGAVALALPTDVRGQVRSIAASGQDAISLKLDSGVVVTWGDATDTPLKGKVVTALLDQHPKTSIDVSAPHNPAVR